MSFYWFGKLLILHYLQASEGQTWKLRNGLRYSCDQCIYAAAEEEDSVKTHYTQVFTYINLNKKFPIFFSFFVISVHSGLNLWLKSFFFSFLQSWINWGQHHHLLSRQLNAVVISELRLLNILYIHWHIKKSIPQAIISTIWLVFYSAKYTRSILFRLCVVVVVYHVTIVAFGHGLLKKFWPFW